MTERPLFIPLTGEWFDAFERGDKTEEFRPNIPRWSETNCRIGRAVTLSRGYGKHRRLHGTITGWRRCGPDAHPAIRKVFKDGDRFVAIRIEVISS